MADTPPIVFIARHGARLDAADKDWHLTSPTPYDPPLSYGGWNQARALGLRIASLLQAPEYTGISPESDGSQSSAVDPPTNLPPTPALSDLCHRYNIVIHASPYLRCLQTAIGVGAGLSQYRSVGETTGSTEPTPVLPTDAGHAGSSDLRALLRVDAFLGEWLSPDYFDQITPPPPSDRMVASAKTELLRRSESISMVREGARAFSGHFPGGWGSQSHPTSPNEENGRCLSSRDPSSIVAGHPEQRHRASTYDTLQGPVQAHGTSKAPGRLNTDLPPDLSAAYVPPTPGYAVSASDPIPSGYVAHARDACINIDYQWDSMRTPSWGTGGEYGEEWSSMHERVHDGFRHMIHWYGRQGGSASNRSRTTFNNVEGQDRRPETVLIIITHGADCNALIGSLAGRPVLLDIGTASLTMAVRRERVKSSTADSNPSAHSPGHRGDRSVAQEYALRLVASTDHLRAGINPSRLTSLSSPSAPQSLPPPSIPSYRNRLGSRPPALQGAFMIGPTPGSGMSPRGWSLASRPSTVPRGVSGLWGSISSPTEKDDDVEEDFVPNFNDPRPVSQDSSLTERVADRSDWTKQLPQRTLSQRGLWGSAPSLEDRDSTSRRRWTVTEQKL
ncbi:uncharacterized protein N7459_000016 [Penicillium hispanicum]|uniref:uncharacterized protein n=1 Tax=Penicillium hispanicum TaxID=1080232 RepID=UPI00253FEEE9|nr:uncharacterized protein N7459_000016 [Penicillium hispanicum]KAJ5593808.1 hypothetical protein N7459_000016 [Penicillium hispanicum]